MHITFISETLDNVEDFVDSIKHAGQYRYIRKEPPTGFGKPLKAYSFDVDDNFASHVETISNIVGLDKQLIRVSRVNGILQSAEF